MHVKIQGGGDGKYANRESCAALVNYLQHEDKERLEKGKIKENRFLSICILHASNIFTVYINVVTLRKKIEISIC